MKVNKNLKKILTKHKVVALDSMCFIYVIKPDPDFISLCQEIFLLTEYHRLVTSVLTLSELLSKKEILLDKKLYVDHKEFLQGKINLELIPVSEELAEESANLRGKYNLRLIDAIQLATAKKSGATLLVTNDGKFRKVKRPEILILSDYL